MTLDLFKWTARGGRAANGGRGEWHAGVWRTVSGPLIPCKHGLHLVTSQQLVPWMAAELWHAEADPNAARMDLDDKIVVGGARVTTQVTAWDRDMAVRFAADCAERVLPLWAAVHPDDDRPRRAIEAARSGGAAGAVRAAAEAVGAAGAAVGAAEAAGAAVWAAEAAGAAGAARAAWAAARAAAWAAWAADGAAAARAWQNAHLCDLLGLEP